MRRPGVAAALTKRILDAAADLFYHEGISATGVDCLATAAAVSKRTLTNTFEQIGSRRGNTCSLQQRIADR